MPAEGMVHALKQIHSLLQPGGLLIDIHPSGEPPPIHVRLAQQQICVGWVNEESEFVSYFQTDTALAEAVKNGWFRQEQQTRFAFVTFADTLDELHDHLAQNWEDMIIDQQVMTQADDLLRSAEADKEVSVREWIKMTALRQQPIPTEAIDSGKSGTDWQA
jgi:hypothetical protein